VGCLEAGVPVFFNDSKGKYVGACFGTRRREATLVNLLNLAVENHECASYLDDCVNKARRRCAALSRGLQADHFSLADVTAQRDRLVSQLVVSWKQPPRQFVSAYSALTRPWTEQILLDAFGGHAEAIAWSVAGVHLGERFSQLLDWQWLVAIADSKRSPIATESPEAWAIREFQEDLPALGSFLGRHLGRFEYWLRQTVL